MPTGQHVSRNQLPREDSFSQDISIRKLTQKSSNTLQYKVGKQRQGSLATIGDKIEETLYSNKVLSAPLTSPAPSFKVKIFVQASFSPLEVVKTPQG